MKTHIDCERGLTQLRARLFLRVEYPRQTFPSLQAGPVPLPNFKCGWTGSLNFDVFDIKHGLPSPW